MEEKKEAKPVQQQEKPKRLEDMSVVELKAVAYNLIRQLEITQTNLKTVNAMIDQKEKQEGNGR